MCRIYRLLADLLELLGRDLGKACFGEGSGDAAGFRVGDEKQRIADPVFDGFGESGGGPFAAFMSLFLRCADGNTAVFDGLDNEFRTVGGGNSEFVQLEPDRPLPALRTHPGTGDAADQRGFRRPHIVAVQTRNGEGLEDVKLDAKAVELVGHGETPLFYWCCPEISMVENVTLLPCGGAEKDAAARSRTLCRVPTPPERTA